jgi:hypothetical protein
MQLQLRQKVLYRGHCYLVTKLLDDNKVAIRKFRRTRGIRHSAEVPADRLETWVDAQERRRVRVGMTCQICGRSIKTGNRKTPAIAHHGFTRPFGWHEQTASCYGAMCPPFEHSCDRLRWYIAEHLHPAAVRMTNALASLVKNDPPQAVAGPSVPMLDHNGKQRYHAGRRVTHNPGIRETHKDYQHFRGLALSRMRQELEAIEREIVEQHKRLESWVAR